MKNVAASGFHDFAGNARWAPLRTNYECEFRTISTFQKMRERPNKLLQCRSANLQRIICFAKINVLLQAQTVCRYIENQFAWVVERSKASGCKPDGLISYVGSNPTPCTRAILDLGLRKADWKILNPQSAIRNRNAGVAQW